MDASFHLQNFGSRGAIKRKKLEHEAASLSLLKFLCFVEAMDHFEFNPGELRPSCSGPADYSSSSQFLGTVAVSPATATEYEEDLLDLYEYIFSNSPDDSLLVGLPPLTDDYEAPAENHCIPDADWSTFGAVVNVFKIPYSTNPAPPAVSRSPSVRCRWPNFVWLICACNRFSHAAAASLRGKVYLYTKIYSSER